LKINIIVPNKKSTHHYEYGLVIKHLIEWNSNYKVQIIRGFYSKLIFEKNFIIFTDIDSYQILFLFIRSIFRRQSIGISVRVNDFIEFSRGLNNNVRNILKKIAFRIIYRINEDSIISIHKGSHYENELKKYVHKIIYDIQMFDLQYLNYNMKIPNELESYFSNNNKIVFISLSGSTSWKNINSVYQYMLSEKLSKKFNFILLGTDLKSSSNLFCINNYVSHEELLGLMNYSDIIYNVYSNNRPSGFFGRALQLEKYVLIKKNSYYSRIGYNKIVEIDSIGELENIVFEKNSIENKKYDSSIELISFIMNKLQLKINGSV
jgi:hypothetical protein